MQTTVKDSLAKGVTYDGFKDKTSFKKFRLCSAIIGELNPDT